MTILFETFKREILHLQIISVSSNHLNIVVFKELIPYFPNSHSFMNVFFFSFWREKYQSFQKCIQFPFSQMEPKQNCHYRLQQLLS